MQESKVGRVMLLCCQGEGTSALSTLIAGMYGPSFEDDTACSTCGESNAQKTCSACKCVSSCERSLSIWKKLFVFLF